MITASDTTIPSVGEVCSQPVVVAAAFVRDMFGDRK